MDDTNPIEVAARKYGSLAGLAAALGVVRSAVHQWKEQFPDVPPRRCVQIEKLTGVKRSELRPHDYWEHWPDLKKPKAPKVSTRAPEEQQEA